MTAPPLVEASGAVLWRPAPDGRVEVALVHRPKYDDWSLPKGKLHDGEHPLVAALREVEEETGCTAVPGRPLGELRYRAFGAAKLVRYWACRATGGAFVPSREVDEVVWLGVEQAGNRLSAHRDRSVLDRFTADPVDTAALVVVRHASAGDRDEWEGPDRDRPLDPRGRQQAKALTELLDAYAVKAAVTADVLRCRQTVEPFVAARGLSAVVEPALTVGTPVPQPESGVAALVALAGTPAVACSQRELIARVVAGTCTRLGRAVTPDDVGEPGKGALVVLHVARDPGLRLVDWERLPALA